MKQNYINNKLIIEYEVSKINMFRYFFVHISLS